MLFRDRFDAGRRLGAELAAYQNRSDVMVLALPRGGVPVGVEVARALKAPLDIFLVRKLGVPGHEELAMGAVASGGVRVLNSDVVIGFGISENTIDMVTTEERLELQRREKAFRGNQPPVEVTGKTVIIVDDGLATGATMKAAVTALREMGPGRIVVAVPVAAGESCLELRHFGDEVICTATPEPFQAISLWYHDFPQLEDEEVRRLLEQAAREHSTQQHQVNWVAGEPGELRGHIPAGGIERSSVRIAAGQVSLEGDLAIPARPKGIVLFAHGSGSGRHSPRNKFVAGQLNEAGLATLLLDLLTPDEELIDRDTGHLRFDIELLANRLVGATDWLGQQTLSRQLPIGYFGASTGGGAALVAAAQLPGKVRAVVSRGGRPDLAGPALSRVQAPTLLIVGGEDGPVISMNQEAMAQMRAQTRLEIVPGATHLFEEPGALESVAELARAWFTQYLAANRLEESPENRAA